MKKVRKYNVQSGLDKWAQEQPGLKKHLEEDHLHTQEEIFIVEGPNGVLISASHEGVHWLFKSMDDKYKIGLWKNPGSDGWHDIDAKATVEVLIREIVKACTWKEYDVKDMVRIFGSRLDYNYSILLGSLRKIGLDLSEYDTDRCIAREVVH